MIENGSGSRPAFSQAARTTARRPRTSSTVANGVLYSSAKRAASAALRAPPLPPMISGGWGRWTGLG